MTLPSVSNKSKAEKTAKIEYILLLKIRKYCNSSTTLHSHHTQVDNGEEKVSFTLWPDTQRWSKEQLKIWHLPVTNTEVWDSDKHSRLSSNTHTVVWAPSDKWRWCQGLGKGYTNTLPMGFPDEDTFQSPAHSSKILSCNNGTQIHVLEKYISILACKCYKPQLSHKTAQGHCPVFHSIKITKTPVTKKFCLQDAMYIFIMLDKISTVSAVVKLLL